MDEEIPDLELLRDHLRTRDERPLRILMQRHLPMVHGVALRVGKDAGLAAEISQDVFLKLLKVPEILMKNDIPLAAWLHRTARHRTIDRIRSEKARKRREQAAAALIPSHAPEEWPAEISEMLDEVIDRLPAPDRELVLQRYFQGRPLDSIGQDAGMTRDAVRMRLKRSLEKMRADLLARGITTTTAALATGMPAHGAIPLPPELEMQVFSALMAGPVQKASIALIIQFMTTTQKLMIGAIVLAAAGATAVSVLTPAASQSRSGGDPASGETAADDSGGSARNADSGRPERGLSVGQEELARKYGATRTRMAFNTAKDGARLAELTLEAVRTEHWKEQELEAMRGLLVERLGSTLGLREDQKARLVSEFLPEWQRLSLESTGRTVVLAATHQESIAETLLALDAWRRDAISEEEMKEITTRTGALLKQGSSDPLDTLHLYGPGEPGADLFEGDEELARRFESYLDAEQAGAYQAMRTNSPAPPSLEKIDLEQKAASIQLYRKTAQLRHDHGR